ncbi:MAG: preprotein translocase subunit SecA [Verrucomicrobiota bacterium]
MEKVKLSRQYDRSGFLKGVLRQRWEALTGGSLGKSDLERLASINGVADAVKALSDEEIITRVDQLRQSLISGEKQIDDIVEPGFALLRETSRRTTGLFHYDEQILGGLALVKGGVAEMATGEGKTLAVSLPAFLFSLIGKGVHVVTVNSYLAERDYEFSKPIFDFLGISIGFLPEGKEATTEKKRQAYDCDITYGVGYEFGFDYMRDQLSRMRHPTGSPGEDLRYAILGREKPQPEVCQRGLHVAIIDEVDSVLIDEAGSPLLISEASSMGESSEKPYYEARDLARRLLESDHFTLDRNRRKIDFTSEGKRELFRDDSVIPWDELRRPWETYVLNALKAEYLFFRDEHYVVEDDKVVIVDEFTGRRFEDRSWREGQHQAVEAKEEVEIRPEADSAASITRQRFFALYDTICGLTGTGAESAGEFWRFFEMPVAPVPLHKPSQREVLPERIFVSHEALDAAVANDIAMRFGRGQPVLVGTRTIKDSERLSAKLHELGLPHRILTAKQDAEEEDIVSEAGQSRSVLIATNMAGRGTHIDLSGAAERSGGLHVIAIERNESVRIDRQLVGRGARQGQPGSAQSFVSADDYLLQVYAPEAAKQLQNMKTDENGELPASLKRIFDKVQSEVEVTRYEMRLRMAERDEWLEQTKETLAR